MHQQPATMATADSPVVGQLYTTQEVAKLLRVNQRTVQKWIKARALTVVRYGTLLRIRQEDLAAFGEVVPRRTPPGAAE
jgi:excisionase family DNA binding protein